MYFALVYYPDIEGERFHSLRKKYEPYYGLIAEHIPLVFPVPQSIGKERVEDHISRILKKWKPFEVHLHGLEKSWDQWLLLAVEEGNILVRKLHDELYTGGLLAPFLRYDLPFIPHVGLGFFGNKTYDIANPTDEIPLEQEKYIRAKAEFEDLKLDFWRTIDCLTLVSINSNFTKSHDIIQFRIE